jgi:plasmid stability protein
MANINVRGISDKTKAALRVRAAKEGLSLEAFARRALQKASITDGHEPTPVLDLAEKYFGAKGGVELDLPPRTSRRAPVKFS